MTFRIPTGEINFSTVTPGDSIFRSVKRCDLMFEVFNHILKAIQDYNRENPLLPLQVPTSDFNDDSGTASQTVVMAYGIDDVTGQRFNRVARYVGNISSYTVPTTGIFAGVPTAFDAYQLLCEQLLYINDKIQPNVVVQSPAGLATVTDDQTQSQVTIATTLPFNAVVDAVTGAIVKKAFNYPVFFDMQENLPY